MKLKNKKTGEIIETCEIFENLYGKIRIRKNGVESYDYEYDSLAELAEEWEDVSKKPKPWWYIDITLVAKQGELFLSNHAEQLKTVGNYFETREEAEKAVEKLKAWKWLKDKGFRFTGVEDVERTIHFEIPFRAGYGSCEAEVNLDFLFGGEE